MREKLPKDAYDSLKRHVEAGTELDSSVANVIASAMKDWPWKTVQLTSHTGSSL